MAPLWLFPLFFLFIENKCVRASASTKTSLSGDKDSFLTRANRKQVFRLYDSLAPENTWLGFHLEEEESRVKGNTLREPLLSISSTSQRF